MSAHYTFLHLWLVDSSKSPLWPQRCSPPLGFTSTTDSWTSMTLVSSASDEPQSPWVTAHFCPQGLDLGIGDLMHLHSFCLDAFMFGLILRQLPVSWSKISGLASYLWPELRFSGITRTGSVWTRVDHHGNLCLMLTCSGPGYLSFVFPTGSWQVQKWNQKGIKIDIFTDQ